MHTSPRNHDPFHVFLIRLLDISMRYQNLTKLFLLFCVLVSDKGVHLSFITNRKTKNYLTHPVEYFF